MNRGEMTGGNYWEKLWGKMTGGNYRGKSPRGNHRGSSTASLCDTQKGIEYIISAGFNTK